MAFGIFGNDQDPYRRLQLATALAGMASGMQQPRLAGWSAPFGGAARGLAQMMPYMMQMQYDQQQQQQQLQHQQALATALQTTMKGLPNAAGNPFLMGAEGIVAADPEAALKLYQAGIGWQPPEQKAPETSGYTYWDKATQTWKVNQAALDAAKQAAIAARAPQQPRQPTELETLGTWLHSNDPMLKKAAESRLKIGEQEGKWHTGKGQGGVEFQYDDQGSTNLLRPSGGFYSVDELTGQIPQRMPLVPRTQQPGGGTPVDLSRYGKPAEAAKTVSPGGPTETQFNAEEKVRDDFNQLPEVKTYKQVLPVIQSAYDTLGRDNRASDINLIYALGKIMDPTSVVREGEMILVQNAASPANQLAGYISYLSGGGKFTPELRQQLIAELQSRTDALQSQYQQAYERYGGIAQSYGLDVSRTIGEPSKQLGTDYSKKSDQEILDELRRKGYIR